MPPTCDEPYLAMMGRLNPSPDPDLSILHSAVSEILPDGLLRVPCSPLREREFELCGVPGGSSHIGMHMHMDTDMHVQHLAKKTSVVITPSHLGVDV